MKKPIKLIYSLTGEKVLAVDPDYEFSAGVLKDGYVASMQKILVVRLNKVTGSTEEVAIPVMHLKVADYQD